MNKLRSKQFASLLFLASIVAMASSYNKGFAQAEMTQIPSQQNPGLLTPMPSESLPEGPHKDKLKTIDPAQAPDQAQLKAPDEPPIVQIQDQKFFVKSFNLEGASQLKSVDVDPIFNKYANTEIDLNQLGKMVEQINEIYRSRGYYTSQAYIPPQDIQSGVVTIKVIEGLIGKIDVSGNRYYKNWVIERNIQEKPGDLLNIPGLEKALNQSNQQQRFRLKATLSPGEETGTTDIRLSVAEQQPWQVSPTFDNQGRPFIGTLRWGTEVTNHNLTGIGDRLSMRWTMARNTITPGASYFVPINRHGTEVGVIFSFGHVNVDLPIRNQPDIDGFAYNYGVLVSQPLDKNRHWVVDGGMLFRRISTFLNDQKVSQDDIRSMQFGLTYNKVDRFGRSYVRYQTTAAPEWMGANRKFWKNEIIANRLFRLPFRNYLILRNYTQLTPDALPAAEAFQIGGAYSVRGFTEGVLLGDRGYSFTVEDRFPLPGLKYASKWLDERIQGAVFFDIGQTWQDRSNISFIPGQSNRASRTLLMGAGVGVRARLTRFAQGFVDFGFGIGDRSNIEPIAQPTCRVHFGVRSDLLSEDYKVRGKEFPEKEQEKKDKEKKEKEAKKAEAKQQKVKTSNSLEAVTLTPPVQ